jgi:uncharacterized protein
LELESWERKFEQRIRQNGKVDPAHDILHIKRVVQNARHIASCEGARLEIVIPSAWLHDLVIVPKNDPGRSQASVMAATAAIQYLRSEGYPEALIPNIQHCIEAHSFSAGIAPESLEAKVVQDADRLDAIGAFGIARCFSTGAKLDQPFYEEKDPFAERRRLNDEKYSLDHFGVKLFPIAETLNTETGKAEARRRVEFMKQFVAEFGAELRST